MYTPEEIREAGLDDFRVFLVQVWDYLQLPPPTPVQLDIAYWLQHGERRVILSAFRGVGKSWITVAFVLWNLFINPQLKIEVVSASGNLADNFSKFAKSLIYGMPILQHLRADPSKPWQRDTGIEFDVGPATESKDPSVKSAGINGQITGSRADIIVADDIEIPNNSYTHHLREKLAERVTEFDAILKPGGRVIYLGTPQVEDTLYNKIAEKRTKDGEKLYHKRVWPAEIPKNIENYGGDLAPFVMNLIANGAKPGDPVDPKRFDRDDLDERFASYGASGYALQFMLDTNPSSVEKHPLKLNDLIVMDTDPDMGHVKIVWGREKDLVIQDLPSGGFDGDVYHRPAWRSEEMAKWGTTVMAIDPSGGGKDELAYAIMRTLHSMLYLVEVGGFLSGYSEETLKALAHRAAARGVNKVITERNYGGGMFDQLLKPYLAQAGAGVLDEEWKGWSTGMKEARILDTLEPVVQNHRLVVDRKVIEEDLKLLRDNKKQKYSFIYQFTRMERTKGALPHDDRVEAVSMAAAYHVAKMDHNREKVVDMHRRRAFDKRAKEFLKNVVGVGKKSGPSRIGNRWSHR